MARKHIVPMGKHKPLGSSWQSFDHAYGRGLMPETRPEFRCYVTGQAEAAKRDYDARLKREAQMQALLVLKQELLDKGLL